MKVLLYIKGLQDWQSGGHEWHMRSSRYMNQGSDNSETPTLLLGGPTGLGTSAARIKLSPGTLGLSRFKKLHFRSIPARGTGDTAKVLHALLYKFESSSGCRTAAF